MKRVMGDRDDRVDGGESFPDNRIRIEIGKGKGTNRVTFAQSRLHFLLLSCASAASTGRFVPSTHQHS
jgi:hypothetical protein